MGMAKLWRYTAVNGASGFGFARVLGRENFAAAAAGFLREMHDAFAEADIALATATVSGGPKFHGQFPAAPELGVRHDLLRRATPPTVRDGIQPR